MFLECDEMVNIVKLVLGMIEEDRNYFKCLSAKFILKCSLVKINTFAKSVIIAIVVDIQIVCNNFKQKHV